MNKRQKIVLASILLLGLILRLLWWSSFAGVIENEGAEYARLAENLFSGSGYTGMFGGPHIFFPPLYPIVIGLTSFVFGDLEIAARVVSLLAGIGLVALVWHAGRKLFDDNAGIIAALMVACHPTLIALSVSAYSEALFLAIAVSAIILSLRAIELDSWIGAGAAGAAWGAAYLVRPEGLVFGMAFLVMTAVAVLISGRGVARFAAFAAAGVLVLALVSAPYIYNLSQKAGQFRWEGKSVIHELISERLSQGMSYGEAARGLDAEGNATGPMLRREGQIWMLRNAKAGTTGLAAEFIANPYRKVRSILGRLYNARYLGSPWIFVFALVGFTATGWWRRNVMYGVFFAVLGGFNVLVAMSTDVGFSRYIIPVLPAAALWASGGIDLVAKVLSRLTERRSAGSQRWTRNTLSVVLCLGLCAVSFYPAASLGEFSQAQREFVRDAGTKIYEDFQQRHASAGRRPVIAGFGLAPAYYAGGISKYMAYAPGDLALRHLKSLNPDYVVLQDTEENQGPYLKDWIANGIPDACARPLIEVDGSALPRKGIHVWVWDCS